MTNISPIWIDNIEILNHTGVENESNINMLSGQLTTGKTYYRKDGSLSESIKFENVLTVEQVKVYHPIYKNLRDKTEKTTVPIVVEDLSFNGVVESLTWDYPVKGFRTYKWVVSEQGAFKPTTKTFQTFNYKKASVNSNKTSKTTATSTIKYLYKCGTFKHDCDKKGRKCVIALQKLLQHDHYYLKYKVDGWWCKYTQREFEKWQKKKAKVRVTGYWDSNCRKYILKRFNIPTNIKGEQLTVINNSRSVL